MQSDTPGKDEKRRRRRRRRLQIILIYTAIAIGLAWFFESQATTTIIFVRHAEKAVDGDDPSLSDAGRERAAELTRQMVDADVIQGIDAIYATQYKRTQETAAPLADALDIPIHTYDANDTESVLDEILAEHKGRIILVVGHSDTLPELIANVGASKRVPPIDEAEYDNVYIVTIPWFGKTKTIRMRFGRPYEPAA
ncbi:MAG TPA: phosphoglycerate mutase family protein [Woeseiaceae bacterium]|nr:phosphoglycerate mutase family protein [Woeseiaceae bacterium]